MFVFCVQVEAMKRAKALGSEPVEKRVIIKPEKLALEGFRHDTKDDTTRVSESSAGCDCAHLSFLLPQADANPLYLSRLSVAAPPRLDAFAPRKKKKGAAMAAQVRGFRPGV